MHFYRTKFGDRRTTAVLRIVYPSRDVFHNKPAAGSQYDKISRQYIVELNKGRATGPPT